MNKRFLLSCFLLSSAIFSAQKKVSIVAGSGYAWRLGKYPMTLSENRRNHLEKMRSGFTHNVAVYYNILPNFGIGLKYYHFEVDKASHFWAYSAPLQKDVLVSTYSSDRMDYYGIGGIYSNFDNKNTRHKYYIDGTVGIMKYKQDTYVTYNGERDFMINNFALAGNIGYMYEFTPNILVGPQISGTAGIINEITMGGIKLKQKVSLFSISANIGATIRF